MREPRIALIVAMAQNRCIGVNNAMPWHLPEDLKYFKRTTLGKPVIMGRKTFDSIGRPLPGRKNIVITRNPSWQFEGVEVVNGLDQGLLLAKAAARSAEVDEIMVIGGAQIYAAALPLAERMYITQVATSFEGDAFFPDFDQEAWRLAGSESHAADEHNTYGCRFQIWNRTAPLG